VIVVCFALHLISFYEHFPSPKWQQYSAELPEMRDTFECNCPIDLTNQWLIITPKFNSCGGSFYWVSSSSLVITQFDYQRAKWTFKLFNYTLHSSRVAS